MYAGGNYSPFCPPSDAGNQKIPLRDIRLEERDEIITWGKGRMRACIKVVVYGTHKKMSSLSISLKTTSLEDEGI